MRGRDMRAYKLLTHAPDRRHGAYVGPFFNDATNSMQDLFYCVALDDLVAACVRQLSRNIPVWFTADVRHDFSRRRGLAHVGLVDPERVLGLQIADANDKALRIKNGNAAPVHAMLLTGVKLLQDTGGPTVWRIQNSWGEKGEGGGFITVSQEWFAQHVFQAAIRDEFVPNFEFDTTYKTALPPWDIFATVAA